MKGMTVRMLLVLLLLPLLQARAHGADHPDDAYAKGRYQEAETAYQKLDMDNPTDLRYRYDRGCAAFQGGKLDEARAAFTSVSRRARDDDMRFRALYNLGATDYKKNDFASARDSYREALKIRPDDKDARRNLELSLKAIRKDQEEKQGQQQNGQGKKDGTGRQAGKEGQQGKQQEGQGKDGQQGQGKNGQQGQDRQQNQNGKNGQQPGQQESGQQQPGQRQAGQGQQGKQDLRGQLKGRDMGSGNNGNGKPQDMSPAAAMERQRAEALLDNTRENRARARGLQGQGGGIPVGSGKEW